MGADRRTPGRALGLAIAAAVHAGVLAALLWRLGATPTYPEPPVMNVELTRPPVRLRPERPVQPPPRGRTAETPPPILHQPPAAAVAPPVAVGPVPPSPGDTLRRTLRGALGCRHAALAGLSADERRACEDQFAAVRPTTQAARLNLDPTGRYVINPEPYLLRMPRKGCKIRAAGDADPMGKEGAAAGISCVWPLF